MPCFSIKSVALFFIDCKLYLPCFPVDPPQTPVEDRMVRNLTYDPIEAAANFTFRLNVSWIPPVYPFKEVTFYLSQWGEQATNQMASWIPKSGKLGVSPMFVCLFVCVFLGVSVCVPVCLFVRLSACLSMKFSF